MIIGIGTDLVSIHRVAAALQRHGERFAQRILTQSELEMFRTSAQQAAFLAKRFAAKEAAAKALGTGIGAVSWQDIEISRKASGAPSLAFSGAAARHLSAYLNLNCHLSITDDADLAQAFVVLEELHHQSTQD